jgi:hypothetical protein
VDKRAVLLGGLLGRVDLIEAAFAADRFACGELGALVLELRFLLGLPFLLASLALGSLLGQVPLDGGWRDALGEFAEHLRSREHLRLVDALRSAFGSPDVSASRCATSKRSTTASAASGVQGAHEGGERLLLVLLLGLRAARVADGHFALFVLGGRLLDAQPFDPKVVSSILTRPIAPERTRPRTDVPVPPRQGPWKRVVAGRAEGDRSRAPIPVAVHHDGRPILRE